MISRIEGSTALLTGASRGIGAILAQRLAAAGVHLVLVARDAARLRDVQARCAASGVRVGTIAADVSQPSDRDAIARGAGEIDILINNAGIETPVALVDQTSEEVEAQIAINLLAPIQLTRLLLPRMLARRRGAIVNVSSMSGKAGTPFNAVYSATKFGLNGFTASLRIELDGSGVHAASVCPAFVARSGMWADTGVRAPALMREVSPEQVVRGVFRAIAGAPEVLVTPGPIRPLLAIRELFPRIEGPVIRRIGVFDALKRRASTRASRHGTSSDANPRNPS